MFVLYIYILCTVFDCALCAVYYESNACRFVMRLCACVYVVVFKVVLVFGWFCHAAWKRDFDARSPLRVIASNDRHKRRKHFANNIVVIIVVDL